MTVVSILRRARPLLAGSAILIVLCAGTDVMHAAQRKPLPAFQLLAADGRATTSQALSDDEQWLIVYVTSACPACDRLLDAIAERQSPLAIPRAVVIVGGDPATLMPYIAGRRDAAPSMRFYADVQQQAALVL